MYINMKKILFCATVYTHLAAFHKPFIKYFQKLGYEVHAAANPSEGRKEEIEELGVVCWDVSFSRSPLKRDNLNAVKEIKKIITTNNFILIHTHTPIASLLIRYANRRWSNSKILYTAHGFHFFKGAPLLNWLLYYPMEYLGSKWTDGLITMNSEDFCRAQKMGLKANHNLFLTNGVGVEESYVSNSFSIREELAIPAQDIVITCVAELNDNKNHQFLLGIWKKLFKENPNVHLLIVGDGVHNQKLKQYVKDNKLEQISFLGFRKDVGSILSESNIITLLSKREGLPKSIMEGMYYSLPAVVSQTRGLRDLVKHNESGFVVELGNDQSLYSSFDKLIKDSQLRKEMGIKGKKRFEKYKIESVIQELDSIYKQFIQ